MAWAVTMPERWLRGWPWTRSSRLSPRPAPFRMALRLCSQPVGGREPPPQRHSPGQCASTGAGGRAQRAAGMGTTIVVTLMGEGRVSVGHVGDSRVYRYGGGRLTRLTEDDSWLAEYLADNPDADPESLKDHPMRNVLTNVVGSPNGPMSTCRGAADGRRAAVAHDRRGPRCIERRLSRPGGRRGLEPEALARELGRRGARSPQPQQLHRRRREIFQEQLVPWKRIL